MDHLSFDTPLLSTSTTTQPQMTPNSYYAKILPLYRKSLEHRRLRIRRVKNPKGLRVRIYPIRHVAVINMPPAPRPSINPLKRRASQAEAAVEPPGKRLRLRKLTNATTIDLHLLDLVPLLKRLRDSLTPSSHIVLNKGRWFLIRRRGPDSLSEPPEFPENLITIRVPPGIKMKGASE